MKTLLQDTQVQVKLRGKQDLAKVVFLDVVEVKGNPTKVINGNMLNKKGSLTWPPSSLFYPLPSS